MSEKTGRNRAARWLAVCLMLGACGCSKTEDKKQDGQATVRQRAAATVPTRHLSEKRTNRKQTRIERILSELAERPGFVKTDELRLELAELFPSCVPELLRIATEDGHPNASEALVRLSSGKLGEYERQVRSLVVKTLGDKDGIRRADALYTLYYRGWPEATDERLVTVWQDDTDPRTRGQALECIPARPKLTPALKQNMC